MIYFKSNFLLLFSALLLMANTCTPQTEEQCLQQGIVLDLTGLDGCGLILEAEDGQRYQVVESPEPLVKGKSLRFDYEEVAGVSICMHGKMVKLTCMEYLADQPVQNNCSSFIYKDIDSALRAGTQDFQLIEYHTEGTQLHLKLGVSGCDTNRGFDLFVATAQTRSIPPQNAAVLQIEPQMCEAFFEVDLCYEMADLGGKTVLLIANGERTERVLYDPK